MFLSHVFHVCSWFRMQRLGSFVGSLSHQFWSHCPSCQSNIEMLLFVYKSLHNQSPLYLCDLLHPHTQSRSLRSADTGLLQVPRARLKNRDDDDQWIPVHIRSALTLSICNSTLKTYLFSMAFSIPWLAVQWLSVLVNLVYFAVRGIILFITFICILCAALWSPSVVFKSAI